MNDLNETLGNLRELTDQLNAQIVVFGTRAAAYAEEVHAAKKNGVRTTSFSGSDNYLRMNTVIRDLQMAHRQVGMTGMDLIRSAP